MHKLLVLVNALVGQNRPGETGQPGHGGVAVGGKCTGPRRVSCPVHAGARHAGDLVDHHGLYGTGGRRRRRAPDTGHRSLNPNVTPPGLRPGAREGEPQARRCRSRVSVPSSAVERGPSRSARPVGRRHAQASRAGQRPGRTEPPRGRPDNRGTAAWQWAGSAPAPAGVSCPVHASARHAEDLVDHHGLHGTGGRRHHRAPDTGH